MPSSSRMVYRVPCLFCVRKRFHRFSKIQFSGVILQSLCSLIHKSIVQSLLLTHITVHTKHVSPLHTCTPFSIKLLSFRTGSRYRLKLLKIIRKCFRAAIRIIDGNCSITKSSQRKTHGHSVVIIRINYCRC